MNLLDIISVMFMIGLCVFVTGKNKKVPVLTKNFLLISRIAASICLLVAVTMVVDLIMPKQIFDVIVINKSDYSKEVSFGIYKEKMTASAYDIIHDDEKVQIHVSRIYDEIKQITLIDGKKQTLQFPTVDCYAFIFMMVVFAIPSILLFKRTYETNRAKLFGFYGGIISIVSGTINLFILGKLFLVHVLHIIPIM